MKASPQRTGTWGCLFMERYFLLLSGSPLPTSHPNSPALRGTGKG